MTEMDLRHHLERSAEKAAWRDIARDPDGP